MSDYPMLISNKLHSFRNFYMQTYTEFGFNKIGKSCSGSVGSVWRFTAYLRLQKIMAVNLLRC